MSITIWVAWRVPITRFGEATDILRRQLKDAFYAQWSKYLDGYFRKHNCQPGCPHDVAVNTVMAFEDQISKIQKEQPFNFNAEHSYGFQFWLDTEFAYIIPYGTWNLKVPDWFDDFHYQNQVSDDEDLTPEEKVRRRQKWDELYLSAPTIRTYKHDVVDMGAGFFIATSEYTQRWFEEFTAKAPASTEATQ